MREKSSLITGYHFITCLPGIGIGEFEFPVLLFRSWILFFAAFNIEMHNGKEIHKYISKYCHSFFKPLIITYIIIQPCHE